MNMNKSTQRGFTLIELVVVIVILGILAAFAVPRFMGLETEARVATVRSMAGTLQSAVAMAHGVCLARGCSNDSTNHTIDGQPITFVNQYPTADTVGRLIAPGSGFTVASGEFSKVGAKNTARCFVRYNPPALPNQRPTYTFGGSGTTTTALGSADATIDSRLRAVC